MGFYIQDDYWEAIEDLPTKQQDEVMGALVRLFFTGENPTKLKGAAKTAVAMGRERVLLARKRASAGASKANQNTEQNINQNMEQNEIKPPIKTESNDQSNVASKDLSNSDFVIKEGEGDRDREYLTHTSCQPSRDDVAAFAASENLHLDVDKFFNHYEANGWRIGSNSVVDWRAAARKAAKSWAHAEEIPLRSIRPMCPKCGSTRQVSQNRQMGTWECFDCHETFKKPVYEGCTQ